MKAAASLLMSSLNANPFSSIGSTLRKDACEGQATIEPCERRDVAVIRAQPVFPAESVHRFAEVLLDWKRKRILARFGESIEVQTAVLWVGEEVLGIVLS